MLKTETTETRHWHPLAFGAGCGLSILLLASWLVEPTRSLWLALDDRFFFAVNRALASDRGWQVFWAIVNNRLIDIVSALTFVGLFVFFVWRRRKEQLDLFIARGLLLTLMVLAAKQIAEVLAMLIDRDSPTLVHPDSIRLSQLVPGIPTKDAGQVVFPGDHATILLVCAGVLTFYLPRRYAVVAWSAAVFFSVPAWSWRTWLTATSLVRLDCGFHAHLRFRHASHRVDR